MLTEQQKRDAVLIRTAGCDEQTAANYVGCSVVELRQTVRSDQAFAAELTKAAAAAELMHMRNIQQAAKQDKYWRASVWWLEHNAPDRYCRRPESNLTAKELRKFLMTIATVIATEVHDGDIRRRLLERLGEVGRQITDSETVFEATPALEAAEESEPPP